MSELHPLLGLIFSCAVLLCMFGFSLYVDWDVKRKSRARLAELERRREESRAYWAPRIAAAQALSVQQISGVRVEANTPVGSVAQTTPPPHNPGRRRFLPLNEPES